MRFVILFIACCGSLAVCAQDLSKELAAMYDKLDGLKEYRLIVNYAAGDTSDLFDEGMASVLISPKGYFYQTDFAEMLINKEHTIVINETEKTLIYSDNEHESAKGPSIGELTLQGVDTLVSAADSVYFSSAGNERTYHLRFSDSYFDVVELVFSGDYLAKVTYLYNESRSESTGAKAVCTMSVEEKPVFDSQLLSSEFYFTGHGEKAVPTEAFTGYVLIYNTSFEESLTK